MNDTSPSGLIAHFERRMKIYQMVIDGLNGQPFSWGEGERNAYTKILAEVGVTLVSKSAIARAGRELKRGAGPVGAAYFGAPIKRMAELYVLECQTKLRNAKAASSAEASPKQDFKPFEFLDELIKSGEGK